MKKNDLSRGKLLDFAENCVEDEQTRNYLKILVRKKGDFTHEEEQELLRRIEEEDEEAAEIFVYGHMWISAALAMEYLNRGLSYYDVMCLADHLLGIAIKGYWKGEGEYPCRDYAAEYIDRNMEKAIQLELLQRKPHPNYLRMRTKAEQRNDI